MRRRLGRAGFLTTEDARGIFGSETCSQVSAFQQSRGLHVDGKCGKQTWDAVLEADHHFGERTLYLRSPMLRGDDVAELQRCLGALGFDPGRIDAIFGPDSAKAVSTYQQNAGLTVDGVCGHDTFAELSRLISRLGSISVATVREREQLLQAPVSAHPARIMVGDFGEFAQMADQLVLALAARGTDVEVVHHPDPTTQARSANEHGAAVYFGLVSSPGHPCTLSYFETDGYVSYGGRHLANVLALELPKYLPDDVSAVGKRLPVLRQTKMPAVVCRLDTDRSPLDTPSLTEALADAIVEWLRSPLES